MSNPHGQVEFERVSVRQAPDNALKHPRLPCVVDSHRVVRIEPVFDRLGLVVGPLGDEPPLGEVPSK